MRVYVCVAHIAAAVIGFTVKTRATVVLGKRIRRNGRVYIILLLYRLYYIRIPPVLNLHLYLYTGKPSCAPDDDIFYARRKKKINK